MKFKPVPVWRKAPFIRYIIPFTGGIVFQWNYCFSLCLLIGGITCTALIAITFNINKVSTRFRFQYLFALCVYPLFFFMGCILTFFKDIRNNKEWVGYHPPSTVYLAGSIENPLQEKPRSYKALINIENIISKNDIGKASGKVILYFQKDSAALVVKQGSRLLIGASIKPVENFKDGAGFDYSNYCALQNIYHQSYLKSGQYALLPGRNTNTFDVFLFFVRKRTIGILDTYIKGKKEAGLAEALLIGYKDNLDKSLVQSYSNTGVVHIIAISGLHVGLFYSILLLILKPFSGWHPIKWISPVILLTGLWFFSLLAGGAPSILRSALMFSVIILGETIDKKSSVYNSLAVSAFLLLCYNPLWIYDTGFQLSYLAVLSLVIFMRPVYNKIYIQNRLLDLLWKMTAVTIAAQILTIPICLYYFHQFPNMFLVTNLVAVPLSSLILTGEIVLCVFSCCPPLAAFTGRILEWMIRMMNNFIVSVEKMPFATTSGLGISVYQAVILYIMIIIITITLAGRKAGNLSHS